MAFPSRALQGWQGKDLDFSCSWEPSLPQSCSEISRSCCTASAPAAGRLPRAHTGDFLREKERAPGKAGILGELGLPSLHGPHPAAALAGSTVQPEGKQRLQLHLQLGKEFTARVQARLHFQIQLGLGKPQELQADLPVCAGRIPVSILASQGAHKPSQGHCMLPIAGWMTQ